MLQGCWKVTGFMLKAKCGIDANYNLETCYYYPKLEHKKMLKITKYSTGIIGVEQQWMEINK
jgi:hypothetical protein